MDQMVLARPIMIRKTLGIPVYAFTDHFTLE